MTKEEDYGERAKEADRSADRTKDYQAKQIYREVAQHWRDMAAQAKRNGW